VRWLGRAAVGLLLLNAAASALRPLHDRWGTTRLELDRTLPGDDRIAHVDAVITRAITIDAPPRAVWPWLVQMGYGRAGWYTYDIIDNLGRPSADRIFPELQRLAPGGAIPSGPLGVAFRVLEVDAPHHLLLGWPSIGADGTWVFSLEALPDGGTRLIERIRGRTAWWTPARWLSGLIDLGEFVMMRKHMLGLRARAERAARTAADSTDAMPAQHRPGRPPT
jgi:hypothetical protein